MQKSRLIAAAMRSIWGFGSPNLALLCRGCCYWRVISKTLCYKAELSRSVSDICTTSFRVICLVCHIPVPNSETASSSCLQIQPPQHGTQKTNNLNFFVTFEIPSDAGRFARSSPGRCDGTCRRHMSIWSRNWQQGSVPEASQAVLHACV